MLRYFYLLCLLVCIDWSFCSEYIPYHSSVKQKPKGFKSRHFKGHHYRKGYEMDDKDAVANFDVASFVQQPDYDNFKDNYAPKAQHKFNKRSQGKYHKFDTGVQLNNLHAMRAHQNKRERRPENEEHKKIHRNQYMEPNSIEDIVPLNNEAHRFDKKWYHIEDSIPLHNDKHSFDRNFYNEHNNGLNRNEHRFENKWHAEDDAQINIEPRQLAKKSTIPVDMEAHKFEKKCSFKSLKFPFFSRKKKNKKVKECSSSTITTISSTASHNSKQAPKVAEDNAYFNDRIEKRSFIEGVCPVCKRKYTIKQSTVDPKKKRKAIHNTRQFYQQFRQKYRAKSTKSTTDYQKSNKQYYEENLGRKRRKRHDNEGKENKIKEVDEILKKVDNTEVHSQIRIANRG